MDPLEANAAAARAPGAAIFPPDLASVVRGLLLHHPVLASLKESALADVLTGIFFASLQTEEHEHHPIRVVLTGDTQSFMNGRSTYGWKQLRFERPYPCTTRNLLRLSRAARAAERLYLSVSSDIAGGPVLTGLAREGFEPDDSTIKLRASEPGCLEIWSSGRRVLEYLHGHIQVAPEDVLLSSGRVRERLLAFAAAAQAPLGYIEAVASIIRHLAVHPHGGILVLSAEDEPQVPAGASFTLRADTNLWDALTRLASSTAVESSTGDAASAELLQAALRAEIEYSITEIGGMTALDGATILDRRLGVRGFGVVLPVRAQVSVLEMLDAAATVRRAFDLQQFGARHRAAASHAATHAGDLVFIASTSGNIGCMLRDEDVSTVMLWRFRAGDLASPAP